MNESTMMFDAEEFRRRLEIYPKIDELYDEFTKFWTWKLETETRSAHILDNSHIDETYSRLFGMAGKWQLYRPRPKCREKLKESLGRMADAYNKIRGYSLLEYNDIPQKPLESIWHELGRVKEENGDRNSEGNYYVVAIAKPLMFLWGQTPAFDSNVRKFMPTSGIQKVLLKDERWTFKTWSRAMKNLSGILKENSEILNIAVEKYGTDSIVPYGRLLDIYYWIGGSPYEKIYRASEMVSRVKE